MPRTTTGARPGKPAGAPQQLPLDIQVDGARVKAHHGPSFASGPTVAQAFYLRDVMQISVVGPFDVKGPGQTASRRRIFICRPSQALSENDCATKILTNLVHHAYSPPPSPAADIKPLMKLYAEGRDGTDFDHGIETALEAVLVSPSFLFNDRKRSAGQRAGFGASHQRCRTGDPPVLLPVEQHFPTTGCWRRRTWPDEEPPPC